MVRTIWQTKTVMTKPERGVKIYSGSAISVAMDKEGIFATYSSKCIVCAYVEYDLDELDEKDQDGKELPILGGKNLPCTTADAVGRIADGNELTRLDHHEDGEEEMYNCRKYPIKYIKGSTVGCGDTSFNTSREWVGDCLYDSDCQHACPLANGEEHGQSQDLYCKDQLKFSESLGRSKLT